MKNMKRFLALFLVLAMALSLLPTAVFAAVDGQDAESGKQASSAEVEELVKEQAGELASDEAPLAVEIEDPGVDLKLQQDLALETEAPYASEELVRAVVVLEQESLLEQGFSRTEIADNGTAVRRVTGSLQEQQTAVAAQITAAVAASGLAPAVEDGEGYAVAVKYHYTVALNGIAVEVPYGSMDAIRALDGVKSAYVVTQYSLPEDNMVTGETPAEPNMYATNESFGSAKTWETLGYTGKGMTVAVIDTGLDLDHPSFAAAPEGASMSLADIESVLPELNAYQLYSATSAVSLKAEKRYRSETVPYGFNYVDCSLDVTHDYDSQGDHGTHVAGTVAANRMDSTTVVGVAPDAQLLIMKVFGQNGGAYSDDIMAAIEDCVRLNVDVINMSLGSPAGFTEDSVLINEVFGRVLDCDMLLAVAAGNSNSAATMNGTIGTNLNLTTDPDIGMVTSPSTFIASTMVASVENGMMMMPYFLADGNKLAYNDVTTVNRFGALEGTYEYVMVPGLGDASDYEGLDVVGKVAVVQRGVTEFTTKQTNAYKAGAVALVVYDNVDGDLISMYDAGLIPNVFVTLESGLLLAELAGEDGIGTLTIGPESEQSPVPNTAGGEMSVFSSWGVTPDLQLAPDVTAPGGNIYSTLMNGQYGTMSGTSMASPHIAGMSALVLQYLHDQHPELSDAEMHVAAESLVMSTATPLVDPDGILYSPRKQGAGSADVYNAIISPVYLTSQQANGEQTPKASLGDDDAKTGVYTFSFEMHNFSDKEHTFVLDGSALTDQFVEIDGREFMGETGHELDAKVQFHVLLDGIVSIEYDANQDGMTDMDDVQYLLDVVNGLAELDSSLTYRMDLDKDGALTTVDAQLLYEMVVDGFTAEKAIKVPANSSATVYVTVTLTEEDKAYMDAHYPNGIYVEGFVRAYAQSEGAVDLSFPFVGFYGDWQAAPVFDTGWYYEDEDTVEYNRYLNVIFATLGSTDGAAGGLGMNPYVVEDYDPEHNVLSPNGDLYYDYVPEIYVSMLRSAELLDFTWTDEDGNELFYEWYAYARKSYYWAAYGLCLPTIYTDGGCQPFTMLDESGNLLVENNDRLTLTIRAYLDDGDLDNMATDANGNPDPNTVWADDVIEVPVVIDLTAPKLNVNSVQYSTEDGRNYVSFEVEDNYDIAAVVTMTAGDGSYEYIHVDEKVQGVDGETATIKIDITDYDSTFRVVLCDYGCNESYYELKNPNATGLVDGRFYAFRRYSTPELNGALYMTDQLNGWYSFENAGSMMAHTLQPSSGEATVYAAEYVDGYIFGAQDGGSSNANANTLFVMKAGSWERIALGGSRTMRKTVYQWPGSEKTYFPLNMIALDMTYDYNSGTMYMLANALENDYFPEGVTNLLLSVDLETGSTTILGLIEGAEGEPFVALTLAADKDGTLYTINYENGKLYTIDVEGAESAYGEEVTEIKNPMNIYTATAVNTEPVVYYPAAYTQSMTFDHETGKLYWAGYQGRTGVAYFLELDKTNGAILNSTVTADNAEMVGLFTAYTPEEDVIPEAELYEIIMRETDLYLNVGQTALLVANPDPYNAELGTFTYTCYDESVATVTPDGIVEAVGVGTTMIEVMCSTETTDCYATCFVNVSDVDGTLFAHSGDYWMLMDAGKPFEASQVVDGMELEGTVSAAAYRDGYIYAAAVVEDYDEDWNPIYTTNLYKLNASTLQGELVGSYEGKTTALAFNYADGFMYGLTRTETLEEVYDEYWGEYYYATTVSFNLIRVNLKTAETAVVTNLDQFFPYSDATWQYCTCSGALAIDYEGNFYVNGDNDSWEYVLIRFNLDENDQISNVETWNGFSGYNGNGDAMVWSERNGGILRATLSEFDWQYHLTWVDVSDMNNVVEIDLGKVRASEAPGVFALAIPLAQEPSVGGVTPTSISLEESYQVFAGETTTVIPSVEPWNASNICDYEIADETIATVDSNGVITGVAVGETTLTVTVPGTELVATAKVVVEKNPGYLFGYFQADIAQAIPLEVWGKISLADPAHSAHMTDLYDFTIYAAAFYDGYVYAYGMSNVDSLYYFLKIDPSSFAYQVVSQGRVLVRDMEFDYTTGTLYAVAYNEVVAGGLYQMDLNTGALTLVGDNDLGVTLTTLAVDDEGVIYAGADDGMIYTVNKDTVELTATGIPGSTSQYLQAMAYDFNNDTIYMTAGGTLSRLDLENRERVSMGLADFESGEVGTAGCVVSGLFSVPADGGPAIPETVEPAGVRMAAKNTVAVGDSLTLNAVVLPVSASAVDQSLTWSSSDETIATVENGVVTGVAAGEVVITATDSKGHADTCTVVVTAEHRAFYGYDEISRSWIRFNDDGTVAQTWADAEGLSPIASAMYVDGVLYAYDAEGYFYTVDTTTFQRTLVGEGIHGVTADLETNGPAGLGMNYDVQYQVIDMTADDEGKLYAAIQAHSVSEWLDSYEYQIIRIDPATGGIAQTLTNNSYTNGGESLRPSNLLYRNGWLYSVNGYITGMITRIDPVNGGTPENVAIFAEYWGDFNGGRSFLVDELTGTVYAIRDKRTGYIGSPDYDDSISESMLCTIEVGIARCDVLYELGTGLRITGLFIK
ncbi:MAG: S8 family serine peptidase [Oscillospiraceae bacterium]|nr:S8 family serine peptidase [Oscillospiraceae bacterium]